MNIVRWKNFRATKIYDIITALPLVIWFLFSLNSQRPLFQIRFNELITASISLVHFFQLTAILGAFVFFLLLIYFLMIRVTPLMRAKGFLPRLIAALGTFVGNSVLFLPVVSLSLALQFISNALIFGGTLMAIWVLLQLGTAFAIMPEARRLETRGPYALVRHPLYVVEAIILLGTILQFQQPWAILIWLIVLVIQYSRSVFEEQVLLNEYPQYRVYQQQTRRFIPGIF